MSRAALKFFSILMFVSLVACGGGGGGDDDCEGFNANNTACTGTDTGTGGGTGGTTTVSTLQLLASSPQLQSNADTVAEGVTLTAIARDANNAVVTSAPLVFSATSGLLQSASSTTDANGSGTAVLTNGNDPSIRTITVTVTSGTATQSVDVQVVGTTVTITGPSSLNFGANPTSPFTVTLNDSGGAGISGRTVTLSASNGNTTTPTSFVTNLNGQGTFTVTGNSGGPTTLTATAQGATGTLVVTVSPNSFNFTSPATNNSEVNIGAVQVLQVQLLNNNVPVAGTAITFSSSRGTISGGDTSANVDMTDAGGFAQVNISSTSAGLAALSAVTPGPNSLTAQRSIEFVATTPSAIDAQASPTSIPTNSQATITAIVRDAANNLVKNQVVEFSITQDPTNGSLSAATAITDSQGIARVFYNSTGVSSGTDGVVIRARVQSAPTIFDPVSLTVGGQSLRITLGTGNTITEPSTTTYALPYVVFVTDANGQPVPSAQVTLSIRSEAYKKGRRVLVDTSVPPDGTGDRWSTQQTAPAQAPSTYGCLNEDADKNGILGPGEDVNGNNTLEPTGDAFVPASVPLAANGSAQFDVTFPQDRAFYIQVRLSAKATVAGTETVEDVVFELPGVVDDFADPLVAPPGMVSPYGQANTCATAS